MNSRFDKIKKQCLPEIEKYLSEFLEKQKNETGAQSSEMTRYQLGTGGKRLRALIPCLVFGAYNKNPLDAVAIGSAIEMIHNATLVHDDLQDGDEVRRNQPTVWKKYSSAQAINCGDAMFEYVFSMIADMDLDAKILMKLVKRAACSTIQVIEGQAQEFLMKEEIFPQTERYLGVIRGKTSGLFALPVLAAMEALQFSKEDCELIEKASIDLGMLFQIQDDLLDIYGAKGRDKKATDVAEGKISILVAFVNEVADKNTKSELDQILRKPRDLTTDQDIARAIEIFENHKSKEAAIKMIRDIQADLKNDKRLKNLPEIRELLIYLSDLFLEPLNEIL